MKKLLIYSFLLAMFFINSMPIEAAVVSITKSSGWFESAYVEWTKEAGYSYNVYISDASSDTWTKLDDELVREYSDYGRADAVGLAAGNYKMKVIPVQNNAEIAADATETGSLVVVNYDRGGFAHFKTSSSTFNPANGVGAYKNDGTLKEGAKVLYVTADNAKTITTDVVTSNKGTITCTGFQNIIDSYQKGYDKTPITFRIIGTIKAENMDGFSSSSEGLQIKGKSSYSEMNITIEGIGFDATVHGFGFLLRNACSVELRNFAIMWCMDDAVSMDTDNSNLWIHNLDLFYGKPGSASDQKKGDGTLDIKGDSRYCTMSYNHLWDSGKSSLCGMTSESGPNYITYHHNWFDHSDSRHPRIRTMSVHIYNNYFDGNSKYGVGASKASDAFVENNYFRNCKYPMLISKQGSDIHNGVGSSDETKGTFSGEDGGIIKAYGNYITGETSFEPWEASSTYNTHFDAYVVTNKTDKVPSSVKALQGGHIYNNFDTDASLMYSGYTCHDAEKVVDVVTGELGAGRCNHGDFSWTFGPNEDINSDVISSLSTAIQNYKSTLVGFFGKTISNGGGSSDENSGSSNEGGGSSSDDNEDSGADNNYVEESFISGETIDDYYFFNQENADEVNAWIADGTITLVNGQVIGSETSSFVPDYSYDAVENGKTFASTEYTGSLQLAKASSAGAKDGGSVIFKCPKGVTTFAVYLYRTGSVYLNLYTSTDGETWKKVSNITKGTSGIFEKNFSSSVVDTEHCVFIKLENTSTGGLNLQGVRILNAEGAEEKEPTTGGETGGETGGGDTEGDANTLYKFTVKEIVKAEIDNRSAEITTLGGTFVFGNTSKIETSEYSASGYAYKLDSNASATNSKYAQANFTTPLKAGDVISIKGYTTSNPSLSTPYGFIVYADQASAGIATPIFSAKNTEETLTLTVGEELAGLKTIYVCRSMDSNKGYSVYFTGIEVNGIPTGIDNINVSQDKTGCMYNVYGMQIDKVQKGQIYIMNGKKYIGK